MERAREWKELIPSLPDELGLECLARLHYKAHRVAARVCLRWRDLIRSQEFYHLRKRRGFTRKVACLVQAIPSPILGDMKPGVSPTFHITVFDPMSSSWERLDTVSKYADGVPLFSQLSSCEGKLVLMGGWDPLSYEHVTDVFIYDFVTRRWRLGEKMPSRRSFFAAAGSSGRIFIAGGHDESKNAMRSAWAYDVEEDEWAELPSLSRERDECEGVVIGNQFWVVSGYGTEEQGVFESSAEVYELESGEWRVVESAWPARRCPRSCMGVGKNRELVSWADFEPGVRIGACGVMLGDWALVNGSGCEGGRPKFFMAETKGGHIGKFEKVDVPDEFSGTVQSGCCVEI